MGSEDNSQPSSRHRLPQTFFDLCAPQIKWYEQNVKNQCLCVVASPPMLKSPCAPGNESWLLRVSHTWHRMRLTATNHVQWSPKTTTTSRRSYLVVTLILRQCSTFSRFFFAAATLRTHLYTAEVQMLLAQLAWNVWSETKVCLPYDNVRSHIAKLSGQKNAELGCTVPCSLFPWPGSSLPHIARFRDHLGDMEFDDQTGVEVISFPS